MDCAGTSLSGCIYENSVKRGREEESEREGERKEERGRDSVRITVLVMSMSCERDLAILQLCPFTSWHLSNTPTLPFFLTHL